MAIREARCRARPRVLAAVGMLWTASHALPATAGEGPPPVVVESRSALPPDCVSLGEVSGRHADEAPRPERAQAEAVGEARSKGATHVVTSSAERCGGNAHCYEGVAYRCPAPGGPESGR